MGAIGPVWAVFWLATAGGSVRIEPRATSATLIVTPPARVVIPAGSFTMGAGADEIRLARQMCTEELRGGGALMLEVSPRCGSRFDAEAPAVDVFVPAFTIDRTEVTVGGFLECVRANACSAPLDVPLSGDPRLPLERASWLDAAAYCRWRGGRLPREAEWEKAARGVGRRIWPWGALWNDARANHGRAERMSPAGGMGRTGAEDTFSEVDGFSGAAPVGSFTKGESVYGVLDLAGNVWEWTSSNFGREPPQTAARFDPRGPTHGSERTIRGGSYRSPPSDLRVTRRMPLVPSERLPGVGFRCAYDVDPP